MEIFDAHFQIINHHYPLVINHGYLPPKFTIGDYRERSSQDIQELFPTLQKLPVFLIDHLGLNKSGLSELYYFQADELINRVRAAEYLGLTGLGDPVKVMTESLYASKQPAEALLILNSIVLMESFNYQYPFDIDLSYIDDVVRENDEVQRRLEFLQAEK